MLDIIRNIKKYVLKSETPGYSRTYHIGDYHAYVWKGHIYIIDDCGATDRPAEKYSKDELAEILKQLESGNYEETRWDTKKKEWIRIVHSA